MTRDSDHILAQLLDECVQRLLDGEPIEDCLARYPEYAPALAPLLRSVVTLRGLAAVQPRSSEAADQSRARFLEAARKDPTPQTPPLVFNAPTVADRNGQPHPSNRRSKPDSGFGAWWARVAAGLSILRPLPAGLLAVLMCVVLVGALTTGMVTVSASALPGDPLYSIKLMAEQARLLLAINTAARDSLDEQIQTERVSEAETILKLKRPVDVMPIAGKLLSFDDKTWNVSGLLVVVNDQTSIVGTPTVGALVRGTAHAPGDGTLVASYLNTQEAAATGGQPTGDNKPGAAAVASPTPKGASSTLRSTPRSASQSLGSPTPSDAPPSRTPRPSATPRASRTAVTRPAIGVTPSVASAETVPASKTLEFGGKILSMQADRWVVAGNTIYRNRQTLVIGDVSVGDVVRVRATKMLDGRVMAQSVSLQPDAPTLVPGTPTALIVPTQSSPTDAPRSDFTGH